MALTFTADTITGTGFVITRTQTQANAAKYLDWLDEDPNRLDLDQPAHLVAISKITADSLGWDEEKRRDQTMNNEDYQKLIMGGLTGSMMTLVNAYPEAAPYANRIAGHDIALTLLLARLKGNIK